MKRPWQKAMQNHRTTPGEFLTAAIIDVVVILSLLVFAFVCLGWASGAKGAELTPGSLLISRNADESLNTSPGHWNHVGVAVSATEVVESQAGQGVIRTKISDYVARPYSEILVLLPRDSEAGKRAAKTAETLVGLKFRKASSIRRRTTTKLLERGVNCVSVAKASWDADCKEIRRCVRPDHVFRLNKTFEPARRLEKPAVSGADYMPSTSPYTPLHAGRYGWYVHKRGQRGGILREMLSRCPSYGLSQIRSFDRVTQCHEATHFVNHELSRPFNQEYGAFYVGDCRYVVLPCPTVTVGQVARYVPQEQRTPRYTMYLCGDRVARNCLSICDEFVCYSNDAQCTKELGLQTDGGLKYANEFCGFADCMVRAVKELDTAYDLEPLTQFVDWQKQRVAELSK